MFPNNRRATIEGVGHWLHAEKPQEFNDLVAEFLQRTEQMR
jgi:esterase